MCGIRCAQVSSLLLTCLFTLTSAETQCDGAMITDCTQAAVSGRLGELRAGGECRAKTYAYFTHSCLVTDYHIMQPTDYCCCVVDTAVLCCRYHQTFDHFRCSLPEDTVYTIKKTFLTYGVIIAVTIVISAVAITIIALISRFCATRLRRKDGECQRYRYPCHHGPVKVTKIQPSAPPLEDETDITSQQAPDWLLSQYSHSTATDSVQQRLTASDEEEQALIVPQVVSHSGITDSAPAMVSQRSADTAITLVCHLNVTEDNAPATVHQTSATDTPCTIGDQPVVVSEPNTTINTCNRRESNSTNLTT